jgi:hypothetical protein
MQNSDSILPVFASIQKMTWYFWGQDRLLSLLPALTMGISDPIANLVTQIFLRTFFSVAAPLVFAFVLWRGLRAGTVLTSAIATTLLVTAIIPHAASPWFLDGAPYGPSLVLAGVGTLLLVKQSQLPGLSAGAVGLIGTVLALLAYMLNIGLAVLTVPLFAFYFAFNLEKIRDADKHMLAATHALCILLAHFHAESFGMLTDFPTTPGLYLIGVGISQAFENIFRETTFLKYVWLLGGLLLTISYFRKGWRDESRWDLILVSAAFGNIILLSQLLHVQFNQYDIRYFLTPVLIISIVAVTLVVRFAAIIIERAWSAEALSTLRDSLNFGASSNAGVAAACFLCVWVISIKLGGIERNRTYLTKERLPEAREIAAYSFRTNSSILVGEYWEIWLALFERLRLDHAAGRDGKVFVATHRGRVLKSEFLTSLLSTGTSNVICVFPSAAECLANITQYLEVPNYVELQLTLLSDVVLSTGHKVWQYKLSVAKVQGREL